MDVIYIGRVGAMSYGIALSRVACFRYRGTMRKK